MRHVRHTCFLVVIGQMHSRNKQPGVLLNEDFTRAAQSSSNVVYGPCRFTQDELLAIDLEGRCVITDHGQFILFNLYGPAITNEESAEERFAYKLRLYKVPQC